MGLLFSTKSDAVFSKDRQYRYVLQRFWYDGPVIGFIGLNPSKANEIENDPTLRRWIGFAKSWGFAGLYILNAFAFCATKPKEMKVAADPVGPANDNFLLDYARKCDKLVACWGTNGKFRGRGDVVRKLLRGFDLYCFNITANGQPGHPLFLPKDTQLIRLK